MIFSTILHTVGTEQKQSMNKSTYSSLLPVFVMYQLPLVAQDIIEMMGLDPVADMIGVYPTLIGMVIVVIGIAAGMIGGKKLVQKARSASKKAESAVRLRDEIEEESSDAEIIEKVNEEDNDLLTEATRRLEQRGDDITGENLTAVLDEIAKEESEDENDGPVGLLDEEGDRGPVARMSVAPERVEEKSDHVVLHSSSGEKVWIRSMIISSYPDRVGYGWLDKFFTAGLESNGADARISYHIWPRDPETMIKQLNKKATRLTTSIRRKQKEGDIDTMEEAQKRDKINRLREQLSKGSTEIFDFALYIQVIAQSEESLIDGTEEVKQQMGKVNARATPLYDRQLDVFKSGAPIGQDRVRKTQIMDLQSLGTTFPFIEPTRVQPTGVLTGFHVTTNSPVVIDRFEMSGHNALVSGKIGSGKSYLTKLMMWRRLMMDPDTELLVIDPVGGFSDMVDALGGQIIRVDSNTIINPLEIKEAKEIEGDVEEDPYDMKIRSVMGMLRTHFSGERSLSKGEEGVLRRGIKYAYLSKGITKDPRTHSRESPTMQDVIEILGYIAEGKQPNEFLDVSDDVTAGFVDMVDEEETVSESRKKNVEREASYAHQVLLGLEEFQHGGQRDMFNGHTNVDLENRVVQFDLSNVVDPNNAGLFMHVMLDYLFQRTKSFQGQSLITIDEAHYMLGEEGPLNILNTFARHSRHYESGMTLISQTVDEFMEGKAKEIYDQCDIRILMRHEDIGQEAMDALGLEPPERDYVLGAQAGNTAGFSECLLNTTKFGKMRLRVYSNQFEHHVVDGGADNVWTLLYEREEVPWDAIPDDKKPVVRRELEMKGKQV